MGDFSEILKFQISREIVNLMKCSLELLEESKDYSLKLEKLLKNAGFEDKEFMAANDNYLIYRKKILETFNDKSRQLLTYTDKFDNHINNFVDKIGNKVNINSNK